MVRLPATGGKKGEPPISRDHLRDRAFTPVRILYPLPRITPDRAFRV